MLGVVLLGYFASLILRGSGESTKFIDGWLVAVFELVLSALCLARAFGPRQGRAMPLILGCGLLSWSLGDIVLTTESSGGATPPAPSFADLFYLGFYPLVYVALILLMRRHIRTLVPSTWLDGAVAGLGVAGVCACFAFNTILQTVGGDAAALATNLAYPIGDVLLLVLVVGGTAVLPGRRNPQWLMLAGACALNATGDTFNLFESAGVTSHVATIFNGIAWPTSILLISASVWLRPGQFNPLAAQRTASFLLPGLGASAGLGILFVGSQHHVEWVAIGLATATLLTVGVRLRLSVRRLRSLTEKRHRQAITDELTGLGNRRHLFYLLNAFFADQADPRTAARQLSLLFIDLDHFKEINDSFGDELLRQLRPRLAGSLRDTDVLVRVGGDELAVITMDTDAAYAAEIAQRLMAKLQEPFVLDTVSVRISAAMGIATAPTDATDSAGLLRCADLAMYRAKSGPSPIELYRHDIDDGGNQLRLVEELRVAVEAGRFELHYQPQVDLRSHEISGVEALLRWPHPRLGLVAPLDFLPLAEEAGLMPRLTEVVLDIALGTRANWSSLSCAASGSASRWTISGPGSRRSRTSAVSRSASSSSTAPLSQASPPETRDVIWRWCGRPSNWAMPWRCASSPKASRTAPPSTSWARWDVTSPRGTSSAGRCRRRTSSSRPPGHWLSQSRGWWPRGSARHGWRGRLSGTAASLLLLTACGSGPAPTSSPTTQRTLTPAPTASATATGSPAPVGLGACPPAQALASLPVLAHTDLSPDDLLALPDGSLWVTDPVGGSLEHLTADGRVLARIADGQAPEGMVAVGSSIVLAEQGPNRLVSFVPPATARSALLTLPARGGQDGVDGIGLDSSGGRLLIPDSPHGTLLSAATDGSHVATLASGLGRDVAATIGPDGAIWVAVEGTHGLWRVPPGGGVAVAVGSGLAQLDDVVSVGSLLYATLLLAGEVVAVDPASGAVRVLARGIGAPQGLALLAGGRLAVADSTTHVIATVATCTA